jgi:hypothetical protein
VSRNNKVNPDHYTMAGRLTPDELARQRRQQDEQLFGRGRRRQRAMPPWMTNEPARNHGANDLVAASQGEQPRESDASGEDAQTTLRDGSRPAAKHKGRGGHLASTRPAAAKASGAGGTRKTRKAASTRGSAARGSSSQRAAKPAPRKGRTKGVGTTRQKQKKGGVSRKAALTRRKR